MKNLIRKKAIEQKIDAKGRARGQRTFHKTFENSARMSCEYSGTHSIEASSTITTTTTTMTVASKYCESFCLIEMYRTSSDWCLFKHLFRWSETAETQLYKVQYSACVCVCVFLFSSRLLSLLFFCYPSIQFFFNRYWKSLTCLTVRLLRNWINGNFWCVPCFWFIFAVNMFESTVNIWVLDDLIVLSVAVVVGGFSFFVSHMIIIRFRKSSPSQNRLIHLMLMFCFCVIFFGKVRVKLGKDGFCCCLLVNV